MATVALAEALAGGRVTTALAPLAAAAAAETVIALDRMPEAPLEVILHSLL